MRMRVLAFGLLAASVAGRASAQNVEMVFTPGVVQQALALKGTLKVEKMDSFSALALVGASPERKKAYADKVAGVTAVVILGDDAVRAAASVQFSVPVIVVNSNGALSARGKVIRVFDAESSAVPAAARPVAQGAAVGEWIAAGHEVAFKGEVGVLVQAVLTALK